MMKRIFFGFLLVCLFAQTYCGYREKEEEYVLLERFAQFHCYKYSTCTPGGDQVCGHDTRNAVLAFFRNKCVMHMANCKRAGFYSEVDLVVCNTKYNYTIQFPDELQFVPILRYTGAPSAITVTTESLKQKSSKGKGDPKESSSRLDETLRLLRMNNKKNPQPK